MKCHKAWLECGTDVFITHTDEDGYFFTTAKEWMEIATPRVADPDVAARLAEQCQKECNLAWKTSAEIFRARRANNVK